MSPFAYAFGYYSSRDRKRDRNRFCGTRRRLAETTGHRIITRCDHKRSCVPTAIALTGTAEQAGGYSPRRCARCLGAAWAQRMASSTAPVLRMSGSPLAAAKRVARSVAPYPPSPATTDGEGRASFLTSAAWLFTSAVGSRLIVLLSTIVVARILAPANLGRVAIAQTAITVLAALSGLGLGLTLTKRVAEVRTVSRELAGTYVRTALHATACGALCITILYVAAAAPLAELLFRTTTAAGVIRASGPAVLCTALLATLQGGLSGMESFRAAGASQGLQSALSAVGLIAGAFWAGLSGALLGLSTGTAVAALASLAMVRAALRRRGITLGPAFNRTAWLSMLRLGAAALASFVVVTTALLVGQLLLAYRGGGYAQVGLFNVSFRWFLAVLLVSGALSSVLLPVMARLGSIGEYVRARDLFGSTLRLGTVASAGPALVLALLAPWLLSVSGPYYSHHTIPFRYLMLAAIPGALNSLLSSASLSLGAVRAWLLSDVAFAVVFFAVALALVPSFGATGLALAYLGGYLATDLALAGPILHRIRFHARDET